MRTPPKVEPVDLIGQRRDLGQYIDEKRVERARGVGEHQDRPEIERIDAAHHRPNLASRTADHCPGEQAFGCLGFVLVIGTARTARRTGGAIAFAAVEVPFGEGDQTFFSSSLVKAGPT